MQQTTPNTKRAQIDRANLMVVIAVSIAAFLTVFSLFATKALYSRQSYQSRVIESREKARDQLISNVQSATKLTDSYKQFVAAQENVIGGSSTGIGDRDGDNARIILDALPSKYDFPALTSSVEKLALGVGVKIDSITGTDDEIVQSQTELSNTPLPVEMPFTVAVSGDYTALNNLVNSFEKSIRPFGMTKMMFTGGEAGAIKLTLDLKSYYQPEKSLEFKKEVVK